MKALSQLVECLMNIVRRDIMTTTAQTAVVCQLSLIGLQLLCRLLGTDHPQLFTGRDTGSVSSHSHLVDRRSHAATICCK